MYLYSYKRIHCFYIVIASDRRERGNLNLLDEIAQPVPSEATNLLRS
jgi:hypothetical protein